MKRILTAAASLAFLAAPALAQSTDGGSTTGGTVVMPETNATGTMGGDNMGSAAQTGDVTAPTGAMGTMDSMGTDDTSTSSTTPDAPMGSGTPTEGMDEGAGAAASGTTPSGGIVPGQTPE